MLEGFAPSGPSDCIHLLFLGQKHLKELWSAHGNVDMVLVDKSVDAVTQ